MQIIDKQEKDGITTIKEWDDGCRHQETLINQGIHWCGKQNKCYPNCGQHCPDYEARGESVITFASTTEEKIDFLQKLP